MGGKVNSKKAAGNARKAEEAAKKQAAADLQQSKQEDAEWSKGAKSTAKQEAQKAKELENARKKAEKAELLKKEEESLKSAKTGNAKKAIKKAQTWAAPSLDHDDLNSADLESKKGSTLAASGIENAIDALGLVTGATSNTAIDRHPERRFKAALLAFQEERMPSLIEETPGLRRRQRLELIYKEFTRSDRNPLNQPNAEFDSSKEDLKEIRQRLERDLEEQFTRED